MTLKVITLTGLKQVDELSRGTKCTPVEDSTMSGDKVIRCKEDVEALEASAPAKLATLSGMKKHRKKGPGHRMGSTDRPCVPEWIAMRTKLGKSVQRCRCRGKLVKSARCGKR